MKYTYVIVSIFCYILTACSSSGTTNLTFALELAGSNREELIKVMNYYKNDTDTLKYAAAIYLIENMPYHYGIYNKNKQKIEEAKKEYISNGFVKTETIKSLDKNIKFETIEDSKHIKADFLISNIDQAFEAWRRRPWGKYYTFEEFCEYLLPYRVVEEPLEEWRSEYSKRYSYILDSIYTGPDVIEAANAVCSELKKEGFSHTLIFNNMGYATPSFLLDYRTGGCAEECNFTIYVLRSLGIPVQTDYYPCSPETFSSHGWCVVLDTTKLNVPLYYTDFFAIRGNMKTDPRKKCKVYRRTYKKQQKFVALQTDKVIPISLKNIFQKDVSAEYFDTELRIPIKDKSKKYYLGLFNQERIIPAFIGDVQNNEVSFGIIESGNIFILLSELSDNLEIESDPFVFVNNEVHYLKADFTKMQDETLYRKYPLLPWNQERMYRIVNARFYGGTQRKNIDRLLYEVCDTPYVCYNQYPLRSSDKKHRYIKYIGRDDVLLELAELHFLNEDKELIPQNIIAGESYDDKNEEMRLSNCFDNNPLTYFLSKNKGDSIIFDFGKEVFVTQALCVPRNDDNFIRIGDEYELLYFDRHQGWV